MGYEDLNGGEYRCSIYLASRGALGSSVSANFERVRREFESGTVRTGKGVFGVEKLKEDGGQAPLVRYIPDTVAVFGADGTLCYASPSLERVLGYKPEDLVGSVPLGLLHSDDIERVAATFMEVQAKPGLSPPAEFWGQHADGSWRCLEGIGNNLLDDPVVRGIVFVFRDVTERKQVEEELRRSESSLATAQRIAHVGNWEYYIDRDEAYWSEEMYRIFGLSPREFVPTYKTFLQFVHPDDKPAIREAVREALYGGSHPSLDYRVVRSGGEVRNVNTQYEVLYDEEGRPARLLGTLHDITDRKVLEERLQYQAFHDLLTGLPNRALVMDRLGHALARTKRSERLVAVLFLDLDNFKFVNDSLGHEEGDRLLAEFAGRLSACVRPEDTVARLGGDEFVVLLEDAGDESDAIRVAQRIIEALRAPFDLEEQEVFTSVSIGIVLGGAAREEPGDLLRKADLALYGAKNKGKARYEVFEEEMTQRSAKRLEMEGALRRALERDEFRVLYQPKMLLRTGGIIGTEALVRWEHPVRGLISPSEFVPLAEETGLIVPIGHKVLEEACRQARIWQDLYPDTSQTMYVNLSARQFNDPDLIEEMIKVVRETGVESGSLALEISENVLMSDTESAITKLQALRDQGVCVVVDDFGTAYSSLSSLGHFPMNSLNVDRSLIFRLDVAPQDTAIVSGMINLAHSLGWEVTAEGVETADQLARLRELGCDMAQGYHLWEPLTSEEVSASLATGPHR